MQENKCAGVFFSKAINVQTKIRPCRGDFFFSKSINVHARLFGTLEYAKERNVCNLMTKMSPVIDYLYWSKLKKGALKSLSDFPFFS